MATRKKTQSKKKKNSKKLLPSSPYEFTRVALGAKKYGKREFRRDVRRLQNAGLYNPKGDVVRLEPTKYALSLIRKFKDVVQGTAKTIAINPGEKKYYTNASYKVRNGRAIIPTPQGEKVRRLPNAQGIPRFEAVPKNGRGLKRTEMLLPYSTLEEYIETVIFEAPDLPRSEYYGFRFFGNNSIRYFQGDDWGKKRMMEYVLKYESIADATQNGNPEVEDEIYQNFQLVKIVGQKDKDAWEAGVKAQRERARSEYREANRERRLEARRAYYQRMSEEQKLERAISQLERRPERAEAESARRKKMRTSDGDAYNAYKEAARKRAAASRAKKKR